MLLADDHFAYVSEMIKFSTGTPKQTSGEVKNMYMTAEILEETRTLYPKKSSSCGTMRDGIKEVLCKAGSRTCDFCQGFDVTGNQALNAISSLIVYCQLFVVSRSLSVDLHPYAPTSSDDLGNGGVL